MASDFRAGLQAPLERLIYYSPGGAVWVGGGLKCQMNLFFPFQLDGGLNGRCQSCSKVPCIHFHKCYCGGGGGGAGLVGGSCVIICDGCDGDDC